MAKSNLKLAGANRKPNNDGVSFFGNHKPTKINPFPRDFWKIEETGDWGTDNDIGKKAAIELAKYMTVKDMSPILGSVVMSMIEKGRYGGVEVGFLHFFAEHAMNSFVNRLEGSSLKGGRNG
ncbi:MAG: hypothetical protein ABL973_14205 [Micropepsaceae bacterium]